VGFDRATMRMYDLARDIETETQTLLRRVAAVDTKEAIEYQR
jgi:hypothetical protein